MDEESTPHSLPSSLKLSLGSSFLPSSLPHSPLLEAFIIAPPKTPVPAEGVTIWSALKPKQNSKYFQWQHRGETGEVDGRRREMMWFISQWQHFCTHHHSTLKHFFLTFFIFSFLFFFSYLKHIVLKANLQVDTGERWQRAVVICNHPIYTFSKVLVPHYIKPLRRREEAQSRVQDNIPLYVS